MSVDYRHFAEMFYHFTELNVARLSYTYSPIL